MVTGWLRRLGPRRAGAIEFAIVAGTWVVGGLSLAGMAGALASGHPSVEAIAALGVFPNLVTIGCVPGTLVAAVVGWLGGPKVAARTWDALAPTALTWLGNAVLIATLMAGFMAAGAFVSPAHTTLIAGVDQALEVFVGFFALSMFVGVLIFGLPGFLIAGVSSFMWTRWMRRTFPLATGAT